MAPHSSYKTYLSTPNFFQPSLSLSISLFSCFSLSLNLSFLFSLSHSFSMEKTRSTTTVPKVRIIHIIAPDIIKTDVSNFRELVQRLTGKPPKPIGGGGGTSNKKRKTQCIDAAYTPEKKPKIEEQTIKLERVEDSKAWFDDANSVSNGCLKSLEEEDGFFFSYECDWYEGVLGFV